MKTPLQKQQRDLVVDIIRNPNAWPGGYEKLLVTTDGALLCSKCCRSDANQIMDEIRDGIETGWTPQAVCIEAVGADCCEDDLISYCDHCNRSFGELALTPNTPRS